MSAARKALALALSASLLITSMPPARADSGVNTYATFGSFAVVVGVLGWVAWRMEKEDAADAFQSRAILPLRTSCTNSAIRFALEPTERPDDRVVYMAGLSVGVKF